MTGSRSTATTTAEIAIVGGGVAGLWLLNRLTLAGYDAVLLEAAELGGGQTVASQGMVHGGIKYALAGALNPASEAIAAMADRWRACLAGRGEIDLSGLEPLSRDYYLFAAAGTLGTLTSFFASRALRGRVDRVARSDYPAAFATGFDGNLYRLNDFVLDPQAMIERLAMPVRERIWQGRIERMSDDGTIVRLALEHAELTCSCAILTAGAGAAALLATLGATSIGMQRRPLHQVIVRHGLELPVYAHCLTGIKSPEPRLTITSHRDQGGWLWYLGGRIATTGVTRDHAEQVAFARSELDACVPWIDWREARIDTLSIDRAEPAQRTLLKPDTAFVARIGRVLVGWPTKLTLAPDLADRVLAQLDRPRGGEPARLNLPRPAVARPPWG
jgi:glycine/D-amino acid oxidase-like deaminating enzyme